MLRIDAMIAVIGSVNEDTVVRVDALPAPGETVIATDRLVTQGGKGANQAVAAARLGADVTFIGCVGDDPAGDRALAALRAEGVSTELVRRTTMSTGSAMVTVDPSGENTIVVTRGANGQVAVTEENLDCLRAADVVLAQLEIPSHAVIAAAGASTGCFVLNAAPARRLAPALTDLVDILVVNEQELRLIGGGSDAAAARSIGIATVVSTLGGKGAQVVTTHDIGYVPALDVPVLDSTGAGDAFCGALVARIHAGEDVFAASAFAATAGSIATTSMGAREGMADLDRVLRAMKSVG